MQKTVFGLLESGSPNTVLVLMDQESRASRDQEVPEARFEEGEK